MRSPAFVTCLQHHIPGIQQNQAFPVTKTLISVTQEIGRRNIRYRFQSPEHICFGDFSCFLYKMPVDIYQKMSIIKVRSSEEVPIFYQNCILAFIEKMRMQIFL